MDTIVFAYSDVAHDTVMQTASRAIAAGAAFHIHGPETVCLDAPVPVIAVDAVRTGCGTSQVTRAFASELQNRGVDTAIVREPMPDGDLVAGRVRRFASMDDLDEAGVTIEERDEYEQQIERDHVVYAGVDYAAVIEQASAEAEVLVVEDGPTLTHGGVEAGAGAVAADQFDAGERVDPEPAAVGTIADTLASYPHLDRVLPAMGYSDEQGADLEATIENADPDLVLAGTSIDLHEVVDVDLPVVRVRYRVEPKGWSFAGLLDRHAAELGLAD